VFSGQSTELVKKVLNFGHFLGLHFDSEAYGGTRNEGELAEHVRVEVDMLQNWFGVEVRLVSFHKPNALALGGSPTLTEPVPHAYERKFMDSMVYLADSYGFWRYGHPLEHEAFLERQSMNLAIHPIWWNEKTQSPLYSLHRAMEEKRSDLREYMLTNLVGV
jgi:hypothetical protein